MGGNPVSHLYLQLLGDMGLLLAAPGYRANHHHLEQTRMKDAQQSSLRNARGTFYSGQPKSENHPKISIHGKGHMKLIFTGLIAPLAPLSRRSRAKASLAVPGVEVHSYKWLTDSGYILAPHQHPHSRLRRALLRCSHSLSFRGRLTP
jgi:hypothetical protein